MHLIRWIALNAIVLFVPITGYAAENRGPLTAQELAAHLEASLKAHDLPGMTALVLRGDQIVIEACAGVRKHRGEERVSLDDKFHLGSDTKAMTATLVGLAIDEGKLEWTTTLAEVFNGSEDAMLAPWKTVTLLQLLAHRGGLPASTSHRLSMGSSEASRPVQRLEITRAALAKAPEYSPGSKYAYSNLGYIVTGTALEKTLGQAWEYLMRERLFKPLGISTGGFGAPATPWGHRANGEPLAPSHPSADNPPYLGPAGTAHMTLRDWAKFIALHLRGDAANPQREVRLLKAETFDQLHTPTTEANYFGGWIVTNRQEAKGPKADDTGRVLTHAGSNTLWYCIAWLAPEIDFAFLIATNQGGPKAAKACSQITDGIIATLSRPQR